MGTAVSVNWPYQIPYWNEQRNFVFSLVFDTISKNENAHIDAT